ncbi:hypothetical protein IV203_037141 [Nitzschia inconspicua]|uniref:Uncharacterized protein n=1 Tax=Nitzschia inconspicua TaxID=303405 RepID=A0A9K3LLD0_9STRA|nr:hypothetical protein IV203_037141 [Nitzschia inconspicua]
MSLKHRVPALLAAFLSSAAVLLAAFAGTTCEFVTINVSDETFFLIAPDGPRGFAVLDERQSSIGVLCNDGLYDREGDSMWELSRIFLILGLLFGSLTAAMAWAICSFMSPSVRKWKSISFFAAIAAVIQVPIFILMEAEPCSDFRDNQTCSLGSGAFVLIASDIFYITVCICTQCMDPPKWAMELDFWKTEKRGASRQVPRGGQEEESYSSDGDHIHLRAGEHNEDEDIYHITRILPASKIYQEKKGQRPSTSKTIGGIGTKGLFSWFTRTAPLNELELPRGDTESTKEHDEDDQDGQEDVENIGENGREYDFRQIDESHMILRVLPDKAVPPNDLDPVMEAAESARVTNSSAEAISDGWSQKKTTDLSSNTTILSDLRNVETSRSASDTMAIGAGETPACTSPDLFITGVRNLTRRLKRDSKRRKIRRQWRTGYAQMAEDDEDYDTDEGAVDVDSPPLEVKLPVLDRSMESITNSDSSPRDTGIQFQMPEFSDDDDEQDIFLENEKWVDLNAATSAGIRRAVEDFDKDDHHPFTSNNSVNSCHSDPEPVIYDSGSEGASFDRISGRDDNSTLSDDLSSEKIAQNLESDHSFSRGRGRESMETRRRRASSPVESIKSSRSLLHTTINEETEEDIKNELGAAYSLSRTVSAPEQRSIGKESVLIKKARVDLMRTLETENTTNDEEKSAIQSVDQDLEVGDIPMLTKSSVAEEAPIADTDSPSENESTIAESSIAATRTWTEPNLLTKETWKEPVATRTPIEQPIDDVSKTWKVPSIPAKDRLDNSDETSDTDDTGCLSRTTDSFSDDSVDGTDSKRIVVRSRSFDGSSFRPKRHILSKSLSPSRSGKSRSILSKADSSATAGFARDIRSRRIQRLKGYIPLEDKHRQLSPTQTPSSPASVEMPSEELTPKRRTQNASPSEKKEDGIFNRLEDSAGDFPDHLFQPSLNLSDETDRIVRKSIGGVLDTHEERYLTESPGLHETEGSPDFDSILEELDLQLIDLRRPVGAEYGDDEGSL